MKMVSLMVGVSLMIELGILPSPANGLEFTGSCLNQASGDTVILKETKLTPWAEEELKLTNNKRVEGLKYDESDKLVYNPRIAQYADWITDETCEKLKLNYGDPIPVDNFTGRVHGGSYWSVAVPSVKTTACNADTLHLYGPKTVDVPNVGLKFYNAYLKEIPNSLFRKMTKEVGFSQKFCSNVRVVNVLSWPAPFTKDFNPEDLVPKCILDNDNKSVTNDNVGSSDAWRVRFLTRVNQHRVKYKLSELLLNNRLCSSVKWSLVELNSLKDKSALKTHTTQGIIDATGKIGWKVQCEDTLLEHYGKGDRNNEPDAIEFIDNLYGNKADPLSKQLFSKDTKEICATVDTIDYPQTVTGFGRWAIGVMFLSKGDKDFNGGTTEIPEYVEESKAEENGVGSHILNLWMISFGVNCLRLFFTFM